MNEKEIIKAEQIHSKIHIICDVQVMLDRDLAMLSAVLKSDIAVKTSIQIIQAFVALKQIKRLIRCSMLWRQRKLTPGRGFFTMVRFSTPVNSCLTCSDPRIIQSSYRQLH